MINEDKYHWSVLLHGLAHALFIVSAAIPFDIRDVKFDQNSQKTIPQVFGVEWARIFSILLLFSFVALMLPLTPGTGLSFNMTFYAAVGIQFVLLLFMNEKRGDLYCAGGIDGAIGLVGLSYFFAVMPW